MSIKKINKNTMDEITIDTVRDFVNKYLLQIMYFVAIVLLIALIVIFLLTKKSDQKNNNITQFYQAINYISENKNDEALEALQNIYNSSNDIAIKTISGMKIGDIQSNMNNYDEAVKIYLEVYNLKNNDDFLKNLSGLSALIALITQNNKENYSQIEELIAKMSNPTNPLLYLVQEQSAWFELQKGNKDQGIEILNSLLKQNIDQDTRSRINSVITAYENENI